PGDTDRSTLTATYTLTQADIDSGEAVVPPQRRKLLPQVGASIAPTLRTAVAAQEILQLFQLEGAGSSYSPRVAHGLMPMAMVMPSPARPLNMISRSRIPATLH